ncbi:MAG: type II secretion system protein [Thermodesulfovibrionales bacterium]
MNRRGITLVELMIVLAIVGILAVALGFEYSGWMGRYKVEKAVKDIYSDLTTARMRAMQRSRVHFVDFPSNTTYRMVEDTNDDGVMNDAAVATFPKTVAYILSAVPWAGNRIAFARNGTMAPTGVLCLSSTALPDYDCILIGVTYNTVTALTDQTPTRIKLGQLTTSLPAGGACDAVNCREK